LFAVASFRFRRGAQARPERATVATEIVEVNAASLPPGFVGGHGPVMKAPGIVGRERLRTADPPGHIYRRNRSPDPRLHRRRLAGNAGVRHRPCPSLALGVGRA
jgi:hypothetical protein